MRDELARLLETMESHACLGHSKRDGAFLRQVENMCLHPGGTGAGASKKMADAVSAYRFVSNESVDLNHLREVRLATALESCPADETLLVINDVSILDYYHHESKSDRRAVGDGRGKGYEYVCNLGLTLENERCVGVLHDCLIDKDGPDDADQIDYHGDPRFKDLSRKEPRRLECNHKHILNHHFNHIADHAGNRRFVQVADREFDDHFIFEDCIARNMDLVIRSNAFRNVQVSSTIDWLPEEKKTRKYAGLPCKSGHLCFHMKDLVEHVPTQPYKAIPLDAKGRLTDEKSARTHANVEVGSFPVTLYRKAKRNKTYHNPEKYVELNVVVVKENDPPKGRKPIQWVLFTTLPIDNLDQIRKIVRIYELRWVIECFFKYLKSGFKIEDLRYDSSRKTAIHLVSITIAASFLIDLKRSLGLPREGKLPPEDYARVKYALANPNDSDIDPELRLFALIANQGGWRGRKADPISAMTLIRGFEKVVLAIEMMQNAADLLNQFAAVSKKT